MKKAAIVRFIDDPKKYFDGENTLTNGKYYNALFTEFLGEKRNNLWIINDQGVPEYFYQLEDFDIIKDEDEILKDKHAIVLCKSSVLGITEGRKYKAIGTNGTDFLVCDDWFKTTYFPKEFFEIIEDKDNVLSLDFMAYDWSQIILNDLSQYKNEPVEILCGCKRGKKHE